MEMDTVCLFFIVTDVKNENLHINAREDIRNDRPIVLSD